MSQEPRDCVADQGQEQMIDNEQIERNKLAAERGWLADPPPPAPEPRPAHHIGKWWRMHGQVPPSER
jgi:hypothetical protein